MNTTIINDCWDQNATGRQVSRANALLSGPTTFVGVKNHFEAAGNLIDSLDAFNGTPGVILMNIAPRNGDAKKWSNGTPFGFFAYQKVMVISSIGGYTLSLVKKLGLTSCIEVFPPELIFQELGLEEKKDTQFRSYDLTPFIAEALLDNRSLSSEKLSIDEIPDMPDCVWWVDNFDNIKTSLLVTERPQPFLVGNRLIANFPCLQDVPDNQFGLVQGSSGIENNRFLEVVINGGKAAKELGLYSGYLL